MYLLTTKVSCGNVTDIPIKVFQLSSWFMTLLQIAVPVVLIIMGSIDMLKGITASKEEEITKGRNMLIKRIILAVLVFFSFSIVKLLVSVVDTSTNSENIMNCVNCFMNGPTDSKC